MIKDQMQKTNQNWCKEATFRSKTMLSSRSRYQKLDPHPQWLRMTKVFLILIKPWKKRNILKMDDPCDMVTNMVMVSTGTDKIPKANYKLIQIVTQGFCKIRFTSWTKAKVIWSPMVFISLSMKKAKDRAQIAGAHPVSKWLTIVELKSQKTNRWYQSKIKTRSRNKKWSRSRNKKWSRSNQGK